MDDIKEIKADVKELLQRTAIHNELLRTHESRSLALQAGQEKISDRITPIEKHVSMVQGGLKLIGLIATIAVISEGIVSLLNYLKGIN